MGIGGGLISTPVRYTNRTILDIHDLCEYQEEKLMFVPRPQFFLGSQTSLSSLKIKGEIQLFSSVRKVRCVTGSVAEIGCPLSYFFVYTILLILNCPWPD